MLSRIENDKWHCILAVIVIVGVFLGGFFGLVLPYFYQLEQYGMNGLLVGLLYFGSIIFAVALQGTYESWQANDPNVESVYNGSYRNFQKNSRADWKWFVIGVAISSAVIGVFLTITLYAL